MSAQANIVAFDGAATPVSHTLLPVAHAAMDDSLIADWREGLTTVPLKAQVRCRLSQRKLKTNVYEVTTLVTVPVMESVSGQNAAGYTAAPQVAYENTVVVKAYYNERATIAERRLARQLALNIAGSVTISVAAVTTGPVPELLDQNIMPS